MLNLELVNDIFSKKDALKDNFYELAKEFDNTNSNEEKKKISENMLKIKDEYQNIKNAYNKYKYEVNKFMDLKKDPNIDKEKLKEQYKNFKDAEKELSKYSDVEIKEKDKEEQDKNDKTGNKEESKEEKSEPLEKGKKYNIKEIAHNIGNGLTATGDAINKGFKFAGNAFLIAIITALSAIAVCSGIGAISALVTETSLISKIIGAGIYGFISFKSGAYALGSLQTYTASKLEGDTLKQYINNTKESKKKK